MTPADYVARYHRRVEGWLRSEAAFAIAALGESQTARGAVGEIGVHHGKLFLLLNLLRRADERGVALDLFERQDLNLDGSGRGDRATFERHLGFTGRSEGVAVISADSTTVTAEQLTGWAAGEFRLFSVDGGHTSEITENDLLLASQVIAPDGLIILDDYFNVEWPGVSEGTNRFLLKHGDEVVAFASAHGKTFLARPAASKTYGQTLASVARSQGWKLTEQDFHGRPHLIVQTSPARPSRRLPGALRSLRAAIPRAMP